MVRKLGDFLYKVVHVSGRLLFISADIGNIHGSIWVGRENPDGVRFTLDVELNYGPDFGPCLNISVEVGVIKVEFYLANHA